MAIIGSLIGSSLGAVGSIFGGISASNAIKKMKSNIEDQMQENQNWYDRRYNEDATQRADAQRMLTLVSESIRDRNKGIAGAQAVMGGTEESTAAAKKANTEAISDTASQIVANADARKDAIEGQYLSTKSNLQNQLNQLELGKAQAISSALGGVADSATGIGSAIDDYLEAKKK